MVWAALLLIAVNLATYVAYGHDKAQSQSGGWRIRESTLLGLAFLGGSPAAKLAQRNFRHKTRKQPFAGSLNAIVFLHCAIALALVAHVLAGGEFPQIHWPDFDATGETARPMPKRFGPGS